MYFFDAVRSSIGADAVDVSDEARLRYGHNRLPGGDRRVDGVVSPASTEDVAAVVRLAGEHGVTLWPTSTGHNFGMGEFSPVRDGQVVLHLGRRMNRILEVDERLGYALVEPGVTFRALRAELARRGDTLMLSGTSGPPDGGILGNALDRGAGYTPARALHVVIFNREDPDEAPRMDAAYEALVAAYDELGHPIGRTPTDRQEWAMQRLPEFRHPASGIKSVLDPKGIIAPGKYGIA